MKLPFNVYSIFLLIHVNNNVFFTSNRLAPWDVAGLDSTHRCFASSYLTKDLGPRHALAVLDVYNNSSTLDLSNENYQQPNRHDAMGSKGLRFGSLTSRVLLLQL